jgi:hypothetical protein
MPTCFQVVKQVVMNPPAFYLFLTLLCLVVPAIVENSWAVDVDVSTVQADDVSIFEMKRWSLSSGNGTSGPTLFSAG